MSYETEQHLKNCRTWLKFNASSPEEFDNMSIDNRLRYLNDGLRAAMMVIAEATNDIQQLEGRVPGDPDRTSSFPFPDSLADKKRSGEGSGVIVPAGVAFLNGKRVA